jgi:hypothetical protein
LLVSFEVVHQATEVSSVDGKEAFDQGLAGFGQAGFDDAAVKIGPLPVHETLLFQTVHDVGHVSAGHEELLGEFTEGAGAKVVKGFQNSELREREPIVPDPVTDRSDQCLVRARKDDPQAECVLLSGTRRALARLIRACGRRGVGVLGLVGMPDHAPETPRAGGKFPATRGSGPQTQPGSFAGIIIVASFGHTNTTP